MVNFSSVWLKLRRPTKIFAPGLQILRNGPVSIHSMARQGEKEFDTASEWISL